MIDFLKEFWRFLRERKKFWILPLLIFFSLLTIMLILSKGNTITPFIYTIF